MSASEVVKIGGRRRVGEEQPAGDAPHESREGDEVGVADCVDVPERVIVLVGVGDIVCDAVLLNDAEFVCDEELVGVGEFVGVLVGVAVFV